MVTHYNDSLKKNK